MSPPKLLDGPAPFAPADSYLGRCRELAQLAGVLNATHGALLDVTIAVLAEGDHIGPGLHSPAQFLAWRTGCSKTVGNQLVAIARRVDELPCLVAALRAGEISLDQAVLVARYVPATYDHAATDLARTSTVEQLRSVLPAYRFADETPEQREARARKAAARRERSSGLYRDDDGNGRLSVHLDPAQTVAVEAALAAARESLFQQRRDDAKAASAETGEPEAKVTAPTTSEAAAAIAATALAAGAAAQPGSERHLITYHLGAGPDGSPCLTDEHGRILPAAERHRLLCDHRFEVLLHATDGTPLSVGRATRHIGRKLRRAVLFRHRGRCAVHGCDATHGLEVHHVIHWEDGGRTDTANLLPLCHRHHAAHHDGLLDIEGNADLSPGTPGCVRFRGRGQPVDTNGTPIPVADRDLRGALATRADRHPRAASTPNGERIDHRTFHLEPDRPTQPAAPAGRASPDGPPEAHGPPLA